MRGSLALERELRIEWRLEFVRFSNIVETIIFRDVGTVMDGSLEDKIGCFVLVREIRKNLGNNRTQD